MEKVEGLVGIAFIERGDERLGLFQQCRILWHRLRRRVAKVTKQGKGQVGVGVAQIVLLQFVEERRHVAFAGNQCRGDDDGAALGRDTVAKVELG